MQKKGKKTGFWFERLREIGGRRGQHFVSTVLILRVLKGIWEDRLGLENVEISNYFESNQIKK